MGGRGYSGATSRRSASLQRKIASADEKLKDHDSAIAAATAKADEYDAEGEREGWGRMTAQERQDFIDDEVNDILMSKGYDYAQITSMENIAAQRKFNQAELDRLNHGQFALFNTTTGKATSQAAPKKQTLDEFLAERGLSSPISDFMVDKTRLSSHATQNQKAKLQRDAQNAAKDYQSRRNAAISEYNSLVSSGRITAPTKIEQMVRTAQGHSDNSSVQAARRALEKRGYDWRTGKKL